MGQRGLMLRWGQNLLLGSALGLLWMPVAFAQSAELTRAEVYRLQNVVNLMLRHQPPRQAREQDIIAPRDALQTGRRSRAELIFNEGSLARIGSNTTFRFVPGLRRYQLPDGSQRVETIFQLRHGVALIVSPPGGFGGGLETTIETPNGQVELLAMPLPPPPESLEFASAAIVIVDPDNNLMQVLALTHNIKVSDPSGANSVLLMGGQTVTVTNGELGDVQNFSLPQFYRTSGLAAGLGPGQDDLLGQEPAAVRETLQAARIETLAAIALQDQWLLGLCTLTARGSASTALANCITGGTDDPLTTFEDQREDFFPIEEDFNDDPSNDSTPNDPNNQDDVGPITAPDPDPPAGGGLI